MNKNRELMLVNRIDRLRNHPEANDIIQSMLDVIEMMLMDLGSHRHRR
jgi:hypothetical protein